VNDRITPWVAIASPVLCYFLSHYSEQLFSGYKFGFEMLLVNGFLTFMGLLIFSRRPVSKPAA
jgi:mannitol-specific phosphotransferase system IIBC component